jgi:hypothetical protein
MIRTALFGCAGVLLALLPYVFGGFVLWVVARRLSREGTLISARRIAAFVFGAFSCSFLLAHLTPVGPWLIPVSALCDSVLLLLVVPLSAWRGLFAWAVYEGAFLVSCVLLVGVMRRVVR